MCGMCVESEKIPVVEEEGPQDLDGLDPMRVGPQVLPCQVSSPGQKAWVSKMRQLWVWLGTEGS